MKLEKIEFGGIKGKQLSSKVESMFVEFQALYKVHYIICLKFDVFIIITQHTAEGAVSGMHKMYLYCTCRSTSFMLSVFMCLRLFI